MALNESPHAGGFILSLANGFRSIDNVTIAAGQTLQAGTVLGKVTATGHYVAYDNDNTNGSQAAAGVLLHPVDTTDGATKQAAMIARDAELNEHELVWDEDNGTSDIANGLADLKALGIIVR